MTRVLCAGLALGVVACGGDDDAAAPAGAGQRPGLELTDEQSACLEQRGVELGQGGRPSGGGPPQQGEERPQQPPELSAEQREQFEQQRAIQSEALEACGIELPRSGPGGGGAPPAAPDGAGTTEQ